MHALERCRLPPSETVGQEKQMVPNFYDNANGAMIFFVRKSKLKGICYFLRQKTRLLEVDWARVVEKIKFIDLL